MSTRCARFGPVLLLAIAALGATRPARATGRDFVDDVLVASGLGAREIGLELGADSRIDSDYRLQGWFTGEVEVGVTRAWLAEGVLSLVNRGRGLELGTWNAESRYVLLVQGRSPVAAALSAEYEVETHAAKHPSAERIFGARGVLTRTFGQSLLATANAGLEWRLTPVPRRAGSYGFGVRYPEDRAITYGFELHRMALERETRLGPELRIAFARDLVLRLGASVGRHRLPYRFVGRAVLETEL